MVFLVTLLALVLWQNVLEALANRDRVRGQTVDAGEIGRAHV